MASVESAARVAFLIEAISRLQNLQSELARLSQQDENHESNRRALQSAIQELRKMISSNVQ
jgi:homoserine kinase